MFTNLNRAFQETIINSQLNAAGHGRPVLPSQEEIDAQIAAARQFGINLTEYDVVAAWLADGERERLIPEWA